MTFFVLAVSFVCEDAKIILFKFREFSIVPERNAPKGQQNAAQAGALRVSGAHSIPRPEGAEERSPGWRPGDIRGTYHLHAPKGQKNVAQGNALGIFKHPTSHALKGQKHS